MSGSKAPSGRGLAARTALVLGLALLGALLAGFLWYVSEGLPVMFSAVLVAVILDGRAGLIRRHTRLPRGLAWLSRWWPSRPDWGRCSGPAACGWPYVIVLYFGAHAVEGYVLTPLIQKEAVPMLYVQDVLGDHVRLLGG